MVFVFNDFFSTKLFRRVLSAPSFYVAFGTDRDIAPPSRFTESHVSLAMIMLIRVGMAMMEVVVKIQIFQSDRSLNPPIGEQLDIQPAGEVSLANFAQREKKKLCHTMLCPYDL